MSLNSKISLSLIRINEIMYDPPGDDNYKEYVELYSGESVNLSGYLIGDLSSNNSLKLIKNSRENNFILIIEEGSNYSNLQCSIYSSGKSIGNGLGNKGDSVFLFDKNKRLVDNVTYKNNYANGNGKSLSLVNGFWTEQNPTPCSPNIINDFFINNTVSNTKNDTIANISLIIKIGDVMNQISDNALNPLTSDIIFESNKEKAKSLIPYAIIFLLLLLSVILILKR